MNQPVHLGIEHSSFLGRLETGGGSAFKMSPELQELQERYLVAKGEKQNMGVAAGAMAMACPIMPLGFLALLFVLGKLDGMDKDPTELAFSKGLKGDMARFAAADALMRKKRENGEDVESNAYLRYASREMELRPLRMAMRPIKGNGDKRVIPRSQSRDSMNGAGFFVTKEKQTKDREMKRQKIMLDSLADADRERTGEKKGPEANQLSEKLEKLDQLLKRMCE